VSADVVELKPRSTDDDAPVRARPRERPRKFCRCVRFELDEGDRRVYCRDCGKEKPAFDALMVFRHEFEKWKETRDRAKSEAKGAQARVEELKREERNIKARLRTAKKRERELEVGIRQLDAELRG
jgi:FtsZ-binding cell division protein ZapB